MYMIVKLNFQQLNETKINWYQLEKLKVKTKQEHNKTHFKRKMKMTTLSEGLQLKTTIHSF